MEKILADIEKVRLKIDPGASRTLEREILAARRIFVAGAGRSGLIARTFAMRLLHLGFSVFVTGEVVTPAITGDDLLISCSGSGETQTTLHFSRVARLVGARLCVITGRTRSTLCRLADCSILIPAPIRGKRGNSLFERTLFIFLEGEVDRLRRRVREKQDFDGIHANLE